MLTYARCLILQQVFNHELHLIASSKVHKSQRLSIVGVSHLVDLKQCTTALASETRSVQH